MSAVKLPSEYRYEMRRTRRWGQWETRYVVESAAGACEFWIRSLPKTSGNRIPSWSGGFEVHSITSDGKKPPDHGTGCWALSGRPCWHDGSSLYASEFWVPRYLRDPTDHEGILSLLAFEVTKRFYPPQEEHS